jgi:hypothetical protein
MKPGSRWVYRETDSEGARQRVVVTVTRRTRLIANGVRARVVHDVVREGGQLVEVTSDENALKPRVLEYKFYAPGVGPVLAVSVSGGSDREELIRFRRGS